MCTHIYVCTYNWRHLSSFSSGKRTILRKLSLITLITERTHCIVVWLQSHILRMFGSRWLSNVWGAIGNRIFHTPCIENRKYIKKPSIHTIYITLQYRVTLHFPSLDVIDRSGECEYFVQNKFENPYFRQTVILNIFFIDF